MTQQTHSPASETQPSGGVRVTTAVPTGRLSLRARGDLTPLNAALGLTLPVKIGQRATAGDLQAICLGPDEWVLQTPETAMGTVQEAAAAVYGDHPHSLVDISGREVTYLIDGPRAAELMTLGCPRDIDMIGVGQGRRTVFDGATVVLWRDGEDSFRMDCWNSFAPHVLHLLETGCRELAAEAL